MSALKESTKKEENDSSMSEISENLMTNHTFSQGSVLEPSMQNPCENMTPNSDQADLLAHSFMDSICANGPARASYVNGSTSPNISDEILLDISKNVPGFLPKSVNAQNSTVTTNIQFDDCDPLRKDGQVTIRHMLTAEDVENRGIWGFDAESPENSMDSYDNGNDLGWNPQKEFMKFLLDDHDHSETEEKLPSVTPSISHRRRKRKMDMVVMVDPSEDLYTDLNVESNNGLLGESSQTDHASVKKGDPHWKRPRSHSPLSKNSQCSNGTSVAFKHAFPKPAKKRKSQKRRGVRERPSVESGSEEEPVFFPSNSNFKEKSHSQRHTKNHLNTQSEKTFICKECGRAFYCHNSLLKHITVHQKKRKKFGGEVKGTDKLRDEGEDARFLCPQCPFGTNSPNTFVQHAKTHEKDKRYFHCQKCSFVAMNESEMEAHVLYKHHSTDAEYVVMGKHHGVQGQKGGASVTNAAISFSCKMCPFKTKNKNLIRNHEFLHQKISDGELGEHLQSTRNSQRRANKSKSEQPSSLCKLSSAASRSAEEKINSLAKVSRKKESPSSDEVLETDRIKQKKTTNHKLAKKESRLDKSIRTLLCRKRQSQQRGLESSSPQKSKKNTITAESLDPHKCSDSSSDSDTTTSGKKESLSPSGRKGGQFASLSSDRNGDVCLPVSSNDSSPQKDKSVSNSDHLALVSPVLKKSPSKRKMSTPFRNVQAQDILIDFPKCRQIFKKKDFIGIRKGVSSNEGFSYDATNNSSIHSADKEGKEGLHVSSQLSRKHSSPTKGSPRASSGHSEQDTDSLQLFSIKEEYTETEVCVDASEVGTAVKNECHGEFEMELKSCPYCPAVFESGIGLSNHVRGHLHRVGLSYNARHEVSPAQVACQDKVPPVRRRVIPIAEVKTETDLTQAEPLTESPEQQSELTCPLCREWFDTRTGLSNHVRGHLKRLGKPCSTSNTKSPVVILKELMRDKKQFQIKLQALQKKCRASKSSSAFRISNGLVCSASKVQRFRQGSKQHGHASPRPGEEKKKTETKDVLKGSPSSDLIGLLKKRKAHDEARAKSLSQTARKVLLMSPLKERGATPHHCKALPNLLSEKSELNRKVCVHCNATFHSGVSLSNHLRAYARRRRNALLDGTTYDCKQRKQRSRSGSKKKAYPLLHTSEEIYRLTCRFCDLVFQGPLSVQEDWVKHLQRHIMNTAVPRTGAGMVEVTCFPKEPGSDAEPPQAQPAALQTPS